MRNSTQAHLRFLTLAAVHKVLKDRNEVLVLKVRWTFVSTDRSGTKKVLEAPVLNRCIGNPFLKFIDRTLKNI